MTKKTKLKNFSEPERESAYKWFLERKETLPPEVLTLFEHYQTIENELKNSDKKKNFILTELRRAMGITASSERKKSGRSQKTKEDKRKALVKELDYHKNKIDWHKLKIKKIKIMEKDIEKKIKSIDEIVLSDEDLADIQRQSEHEMHILNNGGDADSSYLTPKETLIAGLDAQMAYEELTLPLPDAPKGEEYTFAFSDPRVRYDLAFNLKKLSINVEKGHDSLGNLISSSTWILGPSRFQVTWQFLASMTLLVTQYAMPFERLARLVSCEEKTFTSNHIWRMFSYVAQRLLPIYLQLGKDISGADLLSGDDTSVRVVECSRALERQERPWNDYADPQKAQENLKNNPHALEYQLAAQLGFEFPKKVGNGPKTKFNTSLIWGKSQADPKSYIIFYRSHFGGFGDLLTVLLKNRPQEKKTLYVQSDLSTVNLIACKETLEKLTVTQFGCASHARRPFAIHEKLDQTCSSILGAFQNIYHLEKGLDIFGRNEYRVSEMRKLAVEYWEIIRECSEKLSNRWSKDTPLGEGARYIIKNYDILTRYIYYTKVPLTNDPSERMLRMEKLIQANALFRSTLKGRFALDICRTIVQTAVAADINVKEYLMHVLMQKEILDPKSFTPFAYAQCPPEEIGDPYSISSF